MKVLLIHNSYRQRGGEDVVFERERDLLLRAGHCVVEYRRSNTEIDGYSSWQRLGLLQQVVWAGDAQRHLLEMLRRERPDVAHVHNTFLMISPSAYTACRDAGVPVVQTLHNYRLLCPEANFYRNGKVCEECNDRGLWRGVQHGCYHGSHAMTAGIALMLGVHRLRRTWTRLVDAYIAPSEFARQKFVAAGLPSSKIQVKPNFVDPDPGERNRQGNYALFVGRLSGEKGVRTLLAAWERLAVAVPLHIVGDGDLSRRLQSAARSIVVSPVMFRGQLPHQQTVDEIRSARFLVVPSEVMESFGLAAAEAFACGVPVIASDLGAIREIVQDGHNGLHFRCGDAADLSEKVTYAWNRPELTASMGRRARQTFVNSFTAERNYRLLMAIYEGAISDRGQASVPQCAPHLAVGKF